MSETTSIAGSSEVSFSTGAPSSGTGDPRLFSVTRSSTGDPQVHEAGQRAASGSDSRRSVASYAIHRANSGLLKCIDSLERVVGESDLILRTNSFEQFKDQLAKLWEMRTERETEFAEFVNMMQMVFLNTDVSQFSDDQFAMVIDVLRHAHDEEEFDDHLNNELVEKLMRGGLNVFRELA